MRILDKPFRLLWRMQRALTLGAQGVVIDGENRVLLVRHGYRPGWHFPGGGVEWNETVEDALSRELSEEAGVTLTGRPVLHGLFTNFEKFPGDHIAVYLIRDWSRPVVPKANAEIRESGFYAKDALPEKTSTPTRRRIAEIFDRVAVSSKW